MNLSAETTIREIVTECPAAIHLLERLGIDYSFHEEHPLAQACARRKITVTRVVAELEKQNEYTKEPQWAQMSLADLCDYIIEHHHAYTRQLLDLISCLIVRVQQRHGANHPELIPIRRSFAAIEAETRHHIHCGEQTLYSHIAQMEGAALGSTQSPSFQSIHESVHRMRIEHDQTSAKLSQIREKTNNYQPPADACTTFRALWKAFADLEKDICLHIHLENDALFPRALVLAEEREFGMK